MADLIDQAYLLASVPMLTGRSDLATLITTASAMVESLCNRVFAHATGIVDYLDGTGSPRIWVSRPPITTLTSVVYNDQTLTASGDYVVDMTLGRLTRGRGKYDPDQVGLDWRVGTRNVVITYNGGFATIPEPVKMATALMALSVYNATDGDLQSERLGDYSYTKGPATEVPMPVVALLAPYRILPVGRRG